MKKAATFTARIYKIGINPVVDPPENVLAMIFAQADRSKGPIPVRGKLNGAEYIQTLVKFRGVWRLYVNGEMLKASRLKVGEEAKIVLGFDPRPRDVPVPKRFSEELKRSPKARQQFDNLMQSRRKEILRYLGSLKTEKSLERNIEKLIQQLSGKTVDKLHVVLRKK